MRDVPFFFFFLLWNPVCRFCTYQQLSIETSHISSAQLPMWLLVTKFDLEGFRAIFFKLWVTVYNELWYHDQWITTKVLRNKIEYNKIENIVYQTESEKITSSETCVSHNFSRNCGLYPIALSPSLALIIELLSFSWAKTVQLRRLISFWKWVLHLTKSSWSAWCRQLSVHDLERKG